MRYSPPVEALPCSCAASAVFIISLDGGGGGDDCSGSIRWSKRLLKSQRRDLRIHVARSSRTSRDSSCQMRQLSLCCEGRINGLRFSKGGKEQLRWASIKAAENACGQA